MGKHLEICHLGEGDTSVLLKETWEMSLPTLRKIICDQYPKSSTGREG